MVVDAIMKVSTPGSIRGDLGLTGRIHGSDSVESAQREINMVQRRGIK